MLSSILRFLGRLSVICGVVVVMSGVGHHLLDPPIDTSNPTGEAVMALSAGTSVPDITPPGFEETMGYHPDATGKRDGSCSVPDTVAYAGFADACRTHDFGYDLLRFADESGEPLGPWARLAVDRRFHEDMVDSCDSFGCVAHAYMYGFGVGVNSVRQGFTAPAEEPSGPWVMLGALAIVLAVPPTGSSTHRARHEVEAPVLV